MKLCKGMEAALQSRIISLIELDKLLKQGQAASVAFTASRAYLKKMIEGLENAEKQAGIGKET